MLISIFIIYHYKLFNNSLEYKKNNILNNKIRQTFLVHFFINNKLIILYFFLIFEFLIKFN